MSLNKTKKHHLIIEVVSKLCVAPKLVNITHWCIPQPPHSKYPTNTKPKKQQLLTCENRNIKHHQTTRGLFQPQFLRLLDAACLPEPRKKSIPAAESAWVTGRSTVQRCLLRRFRPTGAPQPGNFRPVRASNRDAWTRTMKLDPDDKEPQPFGRGRDERALPYERKLYKGF